LVIILANKAGLISEKEATVNKDELILKIIINVLKLQDATSQLDLQRQFQVEEKKNEDVQQRMISQNLSNSEQLIQKEDLCKKQRDFDHENRPSEKENQQRQNGEQPLVIDENQDFELQNSPLNFFETASFVADTSELYISDAQPTKEGISNSFESDDISTIKRPCVKETNGSIIATKIDLSENLENDWSIRSIAKAGLAIIAGVGALYAISNVIETPTNPLQPDKKAGDFPLSPQPVPLLNIKVTSSHPPLESNQILPNETPIWDQALAQENKIELQKAQQSNEADDWLKVAEECENQKKFDLALVYYTKCALKDDIGKILCMYKIEDINDKISNQNRIS
jgi:hypothetical protein